MDKTTTSRIAHLSRLKVSDQQLEQVAGELQTILSFVEQLSEVDVTGVEPVANVHAMNLRWRQDTVSDGGQAKDVLQNAPKEAADFFVVSKVIE